MNYILLVILLLVGTPAICQSSDNSTIRDTIITSVPHRYQKSGSGNFDSWRLPAVRGFNWVRYVERSMDLSDESNKCLSYIDSNKTISDLLIDLLKAEKITAYSDTLDSKAIGNGEAITIISKENGAINNYMLLECWKFNPSKGKMVVRIIGIAPCIKIDTTLHPIVWFKYYPLRTEFDTYDIFIGHHEKKDQPKDIKRMGLTDYFENRMFSSKIVKVIPYDPSDKIFNQ